MKSVVEHLQAKAEVVYKEEQVKFPQRSQRLVSSVNPKNFIHQRGGNKPARSLIELTDDKHIFKILHMSFVWILKACGNRLSETLLEGPPTEDSIIDMEKQEGIYMYIITVNILKFQTLHFLFSKKMWVIRAGIHKVLQKSKQVRP